jgi:hypothetical protein
MRAIAAALVGGYLGHSIGDVGTSVARGKDLSGIARLWSDD